MYMQDNQGLISQKSDVMLHGPIRLQFHSKHVFLLHGIMCPESV